MARDPVCGMNVEDTEHVKTVDGKTYTFCSAGCMQAFRKTKEHHGPTCHTHLARSWYKERIWQISILTVLILGFSYFIPFLRPLFDAYADFMKLIWWAILLGLFLGGLIERFVPSEYVSKIMAAKGKKSVFNSVMLGFLMSACSHGILAIAIELYKKGASVPSVIAFLMAAPWANLTITIMLIGFFGIKALFLIVGAIIIAILTGFAYQFLDARGWIEQSKTVPIGKSFSIRKDLKERFHTYQFSAAQLSLDAKNVLVGTWSLAKMVLWWILLGMLLASVARAYIPVHIFQQYLGATVLGLFLTLLIATLIEVCSEGSSPLAFEIYNQTGAFGNSFVFLMAGVATDYTEIGLIWSNIGKKAALWLPVIAGPQIVLLGWLFNLFL